MSCAKKRFIPLLDRILVRRAVAASQTKHGIMLPKESIPQMMEGTVVAVGPGARNLETGDYIPPVVRAGDRILLPSYGGTKVDAGDQQELVLFRESDILAKLE